MNIAFVTVTLITTVSLLRDPIFGSESGLAFSRELQWRNQLDAVDGTEHAAFVVDQGGGSLVCLAWPPSHQHMKETFTGELPAGTVAIIHTHPIHTPLPSEQDEYESHRLGIPIYALTPSTVSKAVPSSPYPIVVHRGTWLRPPSGSPQCRIPVR